METKSGGHIYEQVRKMTSESGSESVQYSESLSISDKRRYLEKTKEIGDPYGYPLNALSQDDWPSVRSTDIFNYLVLSTSFCTSERFKAYKSMDAYKYFLSGFVSSVAARKIEQKYVVLGQVSEYNVSSYIGYIFTVASILQ